MNVLALFFRGRLPDTFQVLVTIFCIKLDTGHVSFSKSTTVLGRKNGHRFREHFTEIAESLREVIRKRLQPRPGRVGALDGNGSSGNPGSLHPLERFESSKSNSHWKSIIFLSPKHIMMVVGCWFEWFGHQPWVQWKWVRGCSTKSFCLYVHHWNPQPSFFRGYKPYS